jgi:hypothetical protein
MDSGVLGFSVNGGELKPAFSNIKKSAMQFYPYAVLSDGAEWTNLRLLAVPTSGDALFAVSGAGTPKANGRYFETKLESYDSKKGAKVFGNVDTPSLAMLRWQSKTWVIVDTGPTRDKFPGKGGTVLYTCPAAAKSGGWSTTSALPPATGWVADQGEGPAPSVANVIPSSIAEEMCSGGGDGDRSGSNGTGAAGTVAATNWTAGKAKKRARLGTCADLEKGWTKPRVVGGAAAGPVPTHAKGVCSLNFGLGETSFRDAVDIVGSKGGTEAKQIQAKARSGTEELTKAERAFVSRKYEMLTRPCPLAEVTLEVPIAFGDHLDRFSIKCALDAPEDLGAVLKDQLAEVRHHRLLCFDRPCPLGACLV